MSFKLYLLLVALISNIVSSSNASQSGFPDSNPLYQAPISSSKEENTLDSVNGQYDGILRMVGSMQVNGMNMNMTEGMEEEDNPVSDQWDMSHGIIETILWGFLAEIGSYFPRYFRGWKYHAQAHSLIFWFIWLCSTTSLIAILAYDETTNNGYRTGQPLDVAHSALGISLLILTTFQQFGGVWLFTKWANFKSDADMVNFNKKCHQCLGIFILITSKAQLLEGVEMWTPQYYSYMWGYVAFSIGIRIIIEVYYQYNFVVTPSSIAKSRKYLSEIRTRDLTSDEKILLEMINKGHNLQEIKASLPKMQWCIYGNKVLNCTDYLHPGGNYIMNEVYGREIMRFILGGHGLETVKNFKAHKHSSYAFKMIDELVIGEITVETQISDQNQRTEEAASLLHIQNYHQFYLARKEQICDTICRFIFKTENMSLPQMKGIRWMGKNWAISDVKNPSIQRLYSNVCCMSPENILIRRSIIDYFDVVMEGKEASTPSVNIPFKNDISLYIRRYDRKRSFSKMIHETTEGQTAQKFWIEGLFGRGLELNEMAKGTHVIFAAGTGILPFLDFFNFILMKNMYGLIKNKTNDKSKADFININGEAYEQTFDTSFNVLLIGAFSNENELIGLDIIGKLAEINSVYKLNSFKAKIRKLSIRHLETIDDDKFDGKFIKNLITSEIERAYICGPQDFCFSIRSHLLESSVAQNKIIVL